MTRKTQIEERLAVLSGLDTANMTLTEIYESFPCEIKKETLRRFLWKHRIPYVVFQPKQSVSAKSLLDIYKRLKREGGFSYEKLGKALGVSRQRAHMIAIRHGMSQQFSKANCSQSLLTKTDWQLD